MNINIEIINKSKKKVIAAGVSSLLCGILSYTIFIIDGYTCPDGLIEGLYYYTNGDWALECGRWAIRYLNILFGHNVVMPVFIVFLCCIFATISTLVLSQIFDFNNFFSVGLVSAVFTVNPSIINILLYPHIAIAYSLGLLCTILFLLFATRKESSLLTNLLSVVCLSIGLGTYQSHIGGAAILVLFYFLYKFIYSGYTDMSLRKVGRICFLGTMGCFLDVVIYKTDLYLRNLEVAERVQNVSATGIINAFWSSLAKCYSSFFSYFDDTIFGRRYIYGLLFAILIFAVLILCFEEKKRKKLSYAKIPFVLVGLAFIPLFINIIQIIVPGNDISILMQSHYVLIFPFFISIIEHIQHYRLKQFLYTAYFVGGLLLYTYFISANATFYSLRVSSRSIKTQTDIILADVYHLDGFIPNETTIMFVGFPNTSTIADELPIFRYSIWRGENPAYWDYGTISEQVCREQYLLNYCGIHGGSFSEEQYMDVIQSEEFEKMNIWPSENSVAMHKGMAIVKLIDESKILKEK